MAVYDKDARIYWGPYANQADATFCLTRFAGHALGPGLGVLWSDGQACMLLREPTLDADGLGDSLIAQWLGPLPPPRPPREPTAWERVKDVFWHAMELEGEAAVAEGEAYQAEGEAISQWLGDKDHEHVVAMGFDLLGIAAVALLFVPGIGEVELGLGGLLAAAGQITPYVAGVGAVMGATVDGVYLGERYIGGGSIEARKEAAKEWDKNPLAVTMSLASAIMALPDFMVGGILTLRSLRALPNALNETRTAAAELRAQETTKTATAARLQDRAGGNLPDWHARKLEQKAARFSSRAERLAARAEAAELRTRRLTRKLATIMGVGIPGMGGTPTALGYYLRDNKSDETEPFKTSGKYLRHILEPPYCIAGRSISIGHNLALSITSCSKSPSAAQ